MKSSPYVSLFMLMFVLLMSSAAGAASTAAEITGEIEHLTLNDPADVYSGGVMIVGGSQVILPKNLLIDLPANRLSLQQIFAQAPAACKAQNPPESGLAKADKCNSSGSGGFATLSGVHSNAGNIIAADVLIEKGKEVAFGVVSYINHTDGYFRVNGIPNDPATGVMIRLNDPTGKHTIQQGLGCAGGTNCSADPRFSLDPDNYTNAFTTGYPVCIPSTVSHTFPGLPAIAASGIAAIPAGATQSDADGIGDRACPSTNRSALLVEPPVNDSRVFAPLKVGDSVNAEGNYETVGGTRFLSAHTMRINKALSTKNVAGQPDYMFLEEVFVEAPGFQNQRARALIIGFTTLAPTDVDFWSIHRDPTTNSVHEFPLASVNGCDVANGVGTCSGQGLIGAGANIFRIRYDVDFLLAAAGTPGGASAKLSPCRQLLASTRFTASNPGLCPGLGSATEFADNFGIMLPAPREVQARTGHLLDNPANSLVTKDISGNPATNGQYLIPFGINLGGTETSDFLEVDINLLTTPRSFEGLPWNLDRRLSPSGCLKATGCEATPQPLDPFPFTGLDPRTQAGFLVAGLPGGTPTGNFNDRNFTASLLTVANNRVFSFVDAALGNFNGNTTLLPCATGTFPANCPPDPALITIVPTPVLNIFPPVTDEDNVTTPTGVAIPINVLANDIAVLGTLDPTSVKIVSAPANGTASVNLVTGEITYTPTAVFSVGTATFTYTVANNFGAVSQPATVTVAITVKPTAVNDTSSVPAASIKTIILAGNDIAGTSPLKLQSVSIVSPASCGTLVNNLDGDVTFTAPATPPTPPTCSFSYTISDISTPALISNVATVTLTITTSVAPAAANDPATTTTGSTVIIPVLGNDSSPGSLLNPASVAVTAPTGGSAAANLDGTVTYTAPATAGTYTFTYTVKNSAATPLTSNVATVTVTVTAGAIPAVPTLTGPTGIISNTNPTYAWTAIAGATDYDLFTDINGVQTYLPYTAAGNCNATTCTVTQLTALPNGANVYGVVRAKNISGASLFSNPMTFTVFTGVVPAVPTLVTPSGTSTITPTYTWNVVTGATDYDLFISLNNGASQTFTPVTAAASCTATTCSVTPAAALAAGTNVYWVVRSKNVAGISGWSTSLTFVAN